MKWKSFCSDLWIWKSGLIWWQTNWEIGHIFVSCSLFACHLRYRNLPLCAVFLRADQNQKYQLVTCPLFIEETHDSRLLNFTSTFIKFCEKIPLTEGRSQALINSSWQERRSMFSQTRVLVSVFWTSWTTSIKFSLQFQLQRMFFSSLPEWL